MRRSTAVLALTSVLGIIPPAAPSGSVPITVHAIKASTQHPQKRHPDIDRRKAALRPKALAYHRFSSTAYTGGGRMANGRFTHDGAVAVARGTKLGLWYQVRSGPMKGKILRGEDYIGHGSQFDIWMPSYDAAVRYGRRSIKVVRITSTAARKALWHQKHPRRH